MATLSGVGRSQLSDAQQAGLEAARAACAPLAGRTPQLLIVFAAAGYPMASLMAGVREAAPGAAISGCSGEGIIAQGRSDEIERAVGVLALHSDTLRFDTLLVNGYAVDPAGAGRTLAQSVRALGREDAFALLLFPDGLTGNCTEMLRALQAELPPGLTIAGGTAGDALTFERTFQFRDGEVTQGGLAALLVSGPGRMDVAVSHGCVPIGLERRVTDAAGGWVRAIDGEPAWAVFRQYLDGTPEDLNTEGAIHLSVGEPLPEGAAADYEPYIIRTPMGLDKETGALFFPGGGLESGSAMRLTRRDPLRVRDTARECAERIAKRHAGETPAFVLQFDCAGRGKQLFGSRTADAIVRPLQEAFGGTAAWLGFHSYGEIAPIAGHAYFHNFTVSLCALYDTAGTSV